MTRRDYILLSSTLARAWADMPGAGPRIVIANIAGRIAEAIFRENQSFDVARFMVDATAGPAAVFPQIPAQETRL